MSSIGASYAGVYLMQKRQKEKTEEKKKKKNDEEHVEETSKVSAVHGYGRNNNKKIHPGNYHAPNITTAGPVEEGNNN
ncbi:unnamed protein product [Malus baccata var. baccata]